jgi:hypothetical protein
VRALHDRSQVSPRLGAAVAPVALDAERLRGNAPYRAAIQRVVKDEQARQAQESAQ